MDPMEPFRADVRSAVDAALVSLGLAAEYEVEVPPVELSDFAVPCFPLAKKARKAPVQIAEEIASAVILGERLEKVWADRGYVNFLVNRNMLCQQTLDAIIMVKEDYGRSEAKGVKVLLEHTSVNPTGPIHVGRARNPLIGDTLARCLRLCGYDVMTEYLVNDVGKQVVLLAWGVANIPDSEVRPADRDKADHRLVGYYQRANELMESDPKVGEQVASMLVRFEAGDLDVIEQVAETTELMLEGIRSSLEDVNVRLDRYTWESQFIIDGSSKEVVDRLKATAYCREEDGAFYLELEEFGIHGKNTRFTFTRRDGTTLYTTRDLAYHLNKFKPGRPAHQCPRRGPEVGHDPPGRRPQDNGRRQSPRVRLLCLCGASRGAHVHPEGTSGLPGRPDR